MYEGDDDSLRRKLDRAKRDPSVSPNLKYQLEQQVKKSEKQKLATLNKEVTKKELNVKQQKLKDEMTKQGIQSIQTKPDAKQEIDKAKQKAAAEKAQGQTEKPTQTV
ncbi:MAG: hypothetical protein HOO67_07770 [Candidatus Peribacteraceae bacterium]|nr:hypothetical protein [Candidatus Peribacteraceae bacterium]